MLSLNDQDEYSASRQNAPSWFFLLIWLGWVVLTLAGYLGGQWLAQSTSDFLLGSSSAGRVFSIEGLVRDAGVEGFLVALVSGAVAGLVLGVAQGLMLLAFLKVSGTLEWLIATILGRSTQLAVVYLVGVAMRGLTIDQTFVGLVLLFAMLLVTGILSGTALGYPQSQVFKRRSSRSSWWIVTNVIATAGTAFVIGMTLIVESQNTMRDYSTVVAAILAAIATGFALLEILHHPRPAAEWQETLTWDREDRIASP
jgi:hypothetical protein